MGKIRETKIRKKKVSAKEEIARLEKIIMHQGLVMASFQKNQEQLHLGLVKAEMSIQQAWNVTNIVLELVGRKGQEHGWWRDKQERMALFQECAKYLEDLAKKDQEKAIADAKAAQAVADAADSARAEAKEAEARASTNGGAGPTLVCSGVTPGDDGGGQPPEGDEGGTETGE